MDSTEENFFPYNAMVAAKPLGKVQSIGLIVAEDRDLQPELIFGKSKLRNVAHARQEVYWLSRRLMNYSHQRIASVMNVDHSTVFYGIGKVDERIAECADYSRRMDLLTMWSEAAIRPVFVRSRPVVPFKSRRVASGV